MYVLRKLTKSKNLCRRSIRLDSSSTALRSAQKEQHHNSEVLTKEEKQYLLFKSTENSLLSSLKSYNDLKKLNDDPKIRKETLVREYTHEIPISYQPEYIEPKWQSFWKHASLNYPHYQKKKRPFTISTLTKGINSKYNLNDSYESVLNDVLVRKARMQGRDTLWVQTLLDGGVKTQFSIETSIRAGMNQAIAIAKEQGQSVENSQYDLPHHDSLKEIGKNWRQARLSEISETESILGVSAAESLSKFTLDDHFNLAARKAFFRLWKNKKIYRKYAMANYCPTLKTIINDEDIEYRKFPTQTDYRIKSAINPNNRKLDQIVELGVEHFVAFPVIDSKTEDVAEIEISTERPEFILAATAIAVDPEDEKHKDLIGKFVLNPLTDVEIPIIRDNKKTWSTIQREKKPSIVVPLHNSKDFELVRNQSLAILDISCLDGFGNISISDEKDVEILKSKGIEVQGLSRFKGRDIILNALEAASIYRGFREVGNDAPPIKICKITGDIIEEIATDQWFFKAEEYAQDAYNILFGNKIEFSSGESNNPHQEYKLTITPHSKKEELAQHLEKIKDWPISRQTWWGETLPVYELLAVDGGKTIGKEPLYNVYFHERSLNRDFLKIWREKYTWDNFIQNYKEGKRYSFFDPNLYRYDFFMAENYFQENEEIWFPGEDDHQARKEAAEALRLAGMNFQFKNATHRHNPMEKFEMMQDIDQFDDNFIKGLCNFTSLGWPSHQEETGLLAPFKRRYPMDVLTFKHENFLEEASQSIILSLALTGLMPANRFIIYNDIIDEKSSKNFSLKSGNLNFVSPKNLIYGADLQDLISDVNESSEISDHRKKNIISELVKKFENSDGLESTSADAVRLSLLSGRQALVMGEKGTGHELKHAKIDFLKSNQKSFELIETIWDSFYHSQRTSNLILGLKIPSEINTNLPRMDDLTSLPLEAQLILSQLFKIINTANLDTELAQSKNLIKSIPEFLKNLAKFRNIVETYAEEYKKFDLYDFNDLYKALLFSARDNVKAKLSGEAESNKTFNLEDMQDIKKYLSKIQKLQSDITDCNNVLWRVLENFIKLIGPIVPHVAEELWQYIPEKYQFKDSSVENLYPDLDKEFSSITISPYPNRLYNRRLLNRDLESNFQDLDKILVKQSGPLGPDRGGPP